MEIINNSRWNFWDLFKKTIGNLQNCKSVLEYERAIIRFLERIPSGDYTNLREEWNKRE